MLTSLKSSETIKVRANIARIIRPENALVRLLAAVSGGHDTADLSINRETKAPIVMASLRASETSKHV